MDEEDNKPKFQLFNFEKERAKLELETDEVEESEANQYYNHLFKLYEQCVIAFSLIPSETNFLLARSKLRESFNHALSFIDLDNIEDTIDEIQEIDFTEELTDDLEDLTEGLENLVKTKSNDKIQDIEEDIELLYVELDRLLEKLDKAEE